MTSKTLTINTDGGSRGNPGPAAWGFVVKEDGEVIHKDKGYMGISTNNRAEYTAVLMAMEWLKENQLSVISSQLSDNQISDVRSDQQKSDYPKTEYRELKTDIVTFILDSELVARQLSGIYKIKDAELQKLASEIKDLEKKLTCAIRYTVVRRELNKEADLLVNTSLDENSPGSH